MRWYEQGAPTAAAHPLLVELFKMLPIPGTEWPLETRVLWLKTAAGIFNLLYGDVGDIEITWSPREDGQ